MSRLSNITGSKTTPQVFLQGNYLGGDDGMHACMTIVHLSHVTDLHSMKRHDLAHQCKVAYGMPNTPTVARAGESAGTEGKKV